MPDFIQLNFGERGKNPIWCRTRENVKFIGWRNDMMPVICLMDIVIHPSFSEGFGRAVLESMALGKPVVASAVGGLREAIQSGENGFLVEPGNPDMLSDYWGQLAGSSELRSKIGSNAKRSVIDRYEIDDKVRKLSDIWMSMVKRT